MARTCTICAHPQRGAIDQALVAGGAYRGIAQQFAASPDAVLRHKAHLPATLAQASAAAEAAHADDLLAQVTSLQARTLAILSKAEEAQDLRTALQGVAQARGNLELLAKLAGQLAQEGTVNLVVSPQWLEVRATLISALAWQARLLRSTSRRLLLNCSRQSGKSTTTGVLAMHTALYEPGALVLLLSPGERQSGELFRRCMAVYRALGQPVKARSMGALHLELANGSRIVALPGKEETTRSFSGVRLLAIDEAARVDDALYKAVRPMLAVSGGRLICMSTPWGKRGWWHESWVSDEAWERYEVPATQCPRIPQEFLEEERRVLGQWFFLQEYACQFGDNGASLFSHDVVMASITSDVQPLFAATA